MLRRILRGRGSKSPTGSESKIGADPCGPLPPDYGDFHWATSSPKLRIESLVGSDYREFTWARPRKYVRYYELMIGSKTYSAIAWKKRNGSLALGLCAEGQFEIRTRGAFHRIVTINKPGFDNEIARLKMKSRRRGTLEFAYGKTLRFVKTNQETHEWRFKDEERRDVLSVKHIVGWEEVLGRPGYHFLIPPIPYLTILPVGESFEVKIFQRPDSDTAIILFASFQALAEKRLYRKISDS